MQYRKEIDGLRAFAVLPVVFYHAGFGLFSGGFIGVDVFFVISGYLITSIIIREKNDATFTFANFYERRARRILPALFLVMVCCIPFAWFLMAPHQIKDFSQSLLSTTIFLSNVFFYLETDYFNDFAETAPLLHTWSLAVEEQYYLLFPPLLLIIWRLGAKWMVGIFGAIAVASLVGAEWASVHAPTANFYLLPSRAWELLIGVLAALYLVYKGDQSTRAGTVFTEVAGGIGLLAIFYAVFAFDDKTPLPGLLGLIPTLGTALIILFASPHTWAGRLLGLKPVVGIGLMSYSLYLWHQPVLAFARIKNFGPLDAPTSISLIILSFVLAYASYVLWESKFRHKSIISTRYVVALLGAMAALFVVLGYWGNETTGFKSYKLSQINESHRKMVIDQNQEFSKIGAYWKEYLPVSRDPFESEATGKRVLILGDSKSGDLYISLIVNKALFPGYQFRRMVLDNACMFSDEDYVSADPSEACVKEIEKLKARDLLDQADIVIISNLWTRLSNPNVEGYIRQLSTYKKNIFIVGNSQFNDIPSLSMQIAEEELEGEALERYMFRNIRFDWRRQSNWLEEQFRDDKNVTFLDKLALFCDFDTERCRLFSSEGAAYIIDLGHVGVDGAHHFGRRIYEEKWLELAE
jgi:peptidoglycan/LPS O-acetylase OafA/YrhL